MEKENKIGITIFLIMVFIYIAIYSFLLRSWLGFLIILLLAGEIYYFWYYKK